jgi:RNA polymerase sigma-70 factor (ECF subfamily)
MASPWTDPETAVVRREHRGALKRALQEAIEALAPDDRRMLRRHVLEGRTVEEIGRELGVVASTVSRRIARARAEVLKHTRRALERSAGLARADFESLVRSVHERLDVSLQRVLGSTDDD